MVSADLSWPADLLRSLEKLLVRQQSTLRTDDGRRDAVCSTDSLLHAVTLLQKRDHTPDVAVPGTDRISRGLYRKCSDQDRCPVRTEDPAASSPAGHKHRILCPHGKRLSCFFHCQAMCKAERLILIQVEHRMQIQHPLHSFLLNRADSGARREEDPLRAVSFQKSKNLLS